MIKPNNLFEAFEILDTLISPEDREKLKNGPEDETCGLHFGFGMGLRNEWGLWTKSTFAKWFNDQGIYHADDMSGIILASYWRYLNKLPIRLEEQIKYYQDFWADQGIDIKAQFT